MAARFVNDFSTTLAAALASGATTCTVTTGVPAALVGSRTACRIGTEIVGVTFTTATVWALVRESEDADRYPQRAWPAGTAVDPVLTEALLAELAGQSVAAGAATGNTLWVDPLGDDATGTPERADKPYLTITAAKAAAPAGATVVVRPGTYDEYRIEADGVILWFEPGARVINTNGILLSEPIFNFGAGTYRVYGHGRFSGGNYDAILAGAGSDWLVECEEVTSDITAIDHSGGTGVVRGARVAGGAALTPWLFHLAGSLRFERCRVEPAAGAAATTLAGAELTFRDCVATTLDVPSGEPVAVEGTLTVGAAPSATTTGGPVVVTGGTAPVVGSDGAVTAAGFASPLNLRPAGGTGTTDVVLSTDGTTATLRNKSTGGVRVRNAADDTTILTLDNSGNLTTIANATLTVPYVILNQGMRFALGQLQFISNSSAFVGPGLASFSGDLTVMGAPIRFRNNANGSTVATFTPGTGTVLEGGASSVITAIRGSLGQTGNICEWQSLNGGTVYSTVTENGYLTTRKASAPADAELTSSEVAWWFDDTSGAPQVAFKGKDSAGTVRSVKVPLGGSADGPIVADADGATVTFDLGKSNKHSVTLGGNRTFALINDFDGQSFTLFVTQDATGSRTVTWWAGIRWQGGAAPTLTTTANKTDVVSFVRLSGGVYLGTYALNF